MRFSLLVLGVLFFRICFGQIPFNSPENPNYWKNKKPRSNYWQQDVNYFIQANVDETKDIIDGEEKLIYTNNSPDTLYFVYFNLYQNAFQPDSYLDDLQKNNQEHPHYGKYENSRQGISIEKMISEGTSLKTHLDNTVLKVFLEKPLFPNQQTSFNIHFRTFFDAGSTRRRMKKYKSANFTHYNGCQWYPKLCVYDAKSGWNTDQHLNREFYGDFGSFDVQLTFANNYVVEATGVLQNEKEVLPDSLKEKLQLRNFKAKKWEEPASIITPYDPTKRKTWIYHADNVHDFAFTADPAYRIADTTWNGVRCVAIAQEGHAVGWQKAAAYCARIIQCFSQDIGMYEYPKMVVADAADGMEYPMLTLDAGRDPDFHGLLVHEIGHNWFYGMLGNNETYRAMLDEGFTQFLTVWGLEKLDGKNVPMPKYKHAYARKFAEPSTVRDQKVYYSYISDATQHIDEPLNTHSDMFNGALGQGGGYRNVYNKTATMLYNLQYVLGDSLFQKALQNYVSQWKFCHPYPEDFRNSVTAFTHADLNWFFDEWMETTKTIDYKIKSVKKTRKTNEYKLTFVRKGSMQMPIDFQVTTKKDSILNFTIPNTWFEKSTFANKATTLDKWYGWDKLKPTYKTTLTIPDGIKNVVIDPTNRMADINNFNNKWKGNTTFRFDSRIFPFPSWEKYNVWARPDIWYNAFDGFKLGVHLRGNFMQVKHVFSFSAWLNTHLVQGGFYTYTKAEKLKAGWFSYQFSYQTRLDPILKKTTFYFQSRWLDGLELYKIGITKELPKNFSVEINVKTFTRPKSIWNNYLIHQNEWSTYFDQKRAMNTSLNLSMNYVYAKSKVNGSLKVTLRSSALLSAFNYHYLEATHLQKLKIGKFDLRTRIYGRLGTGNNLPNESALFFAGANPEEMMENKYMRAAAFTPESWSGFGNTPNHLQYGGGLNLRGYAGYFMSEYDKAGAVVYTYKGNSGFAINAELDFNRLIRLNKTKLKNYFDLNTYFFGDIGAISYTNSLHQNQLSNVRLDAGVGMAFTIKKFWILQEIKPFTIRFDVPFFLSHYAATEKGPFKFRWQLGINRAF